MTIDKICLARMQKDTGYHNSIKRIVKLEKNKQHYVMLCIIYPFMIVRALYKNKFNFFYFYNRK